MNDPILFVPDASCLILFHCFGRLELLEEIVKVLGGKLILVSPVIDELRSVPKRSLESIHYEEILVEDVGSTQKDFQLGKGEASILHVAKKLNIIAIIDDQKARKTAENLGINVKGTLSLLGSGYVLCPITTKRELLDLLNQAINLGFRLPPLESFVNTLQKMER